MSSKTTYDTRFANVRPDERHKFTSTISTVACHQPYCQYQEQQCAAQLPYKLCQILLTYVSVPSLYANIVVLFHNRHRDGPLLHAKFHTHRCNMSPLWGEKPQNQPLSKRNTGRFVLRAMLPVIRSDQSSKIGRRSCCHAV